MKKIILGLFTLSTFSVFAQETTLESNKGSLSVEILGNYSNTSATSVITAQLPAILQSFVNFDNYKYDERLKASISPEIRVNYSLPYNLKAYARMSFGKWGFDNLENESINIGDFIDLIPNIPDAAKPFLGSARLDVNYRESDWTYFTGGIGIKYSYNVTNKLSIEPFVGADVWMTSSPEISTDLALSLLIFNSAAKDIIKLESADQTNFGWRTGLNINYDLTKQLYIGVNADYSSVNPVYETQLVGGNIGDLLSGIPGIDLGGALPNLPDVETSVDSKNNTLNFGLLVGMRF
ncbi:MAG: hypothetical protein N4A45_11785 [Flavobacteriales bacterium]|jgi:opacity protein-like surface antigen|nr:hypothetical protein [Flavobacteriales bacterium]